MKKPFLIALAVLVSLGAAVAASVRVSAEDGHQHTTSATQPHGRWSPEAVAVFAYLPVQEGGRMKPLSTFAGFSLLALNGKRGVSTPAGEALTPTEWLMDCMFFPEEAVHYDSFVVQASEVLDAVGLAHAEKKRRDQYSYSDFMPAQDRIFELAEQYEHIEAKDRSPVQGQLLNLGRNLRLFESIALYLAVLRQPPTAAQSPILAKVFGKDSHPSLSEMLGRAGDLRAALAAASDPHAGASGGDDPLHGWLDEVMRSSRGMALIAPPGTVAESPEWMTPGDVVALTIFRGEPMPEQVAAVADLEAMYEARDDETAFRARAQSFSDRVIAQSERRGEYGKIPLEVAFYKSDFFYYAQIVFVLGFLLSAFSWIKPSKLLTRSVVASVVVATLLLSTGITMRCIIRSRPPVSTLYESVLFITAVAAILMLVTEYVNRRGIALTLANVLGAGGMFLASRYEMQERVDTMPSLVAVLDTNFWLATHVTTVTIGYGAGLLAGAVGHVYVLGKLFGLKKDDPGFYKSLTTMTYGMLCFGLLFSVVGTILGGIWANDSWGRFWGWDPKENGALTIVLWEIIILHARMGGLIRDFGIAMASVFGAAVVASSWWGVNLLGVGLHSYGFTSGIVFALLAFYAVEAAVLAAGGIHYYLANRTGAALPPADTLPPPPAV